MIQFKFRNMKKIILLLTFITAFSVGNAQIYVDVDVATNGNGTSWASAFNNLQDAIDAAAINDEI
jgi:S-adenosylmethionine/arginine decarboxylase-like enzyme